MFSLTEIDLKDNSNLSFSASDQNGWTILYEPEPEIIKEDGEDLWMFFSENRRWKAYIKSLWLESLRKKQRLNLFVEQRIIYYLRLMLPISGWIARVGYRKKRN